MNTPRKFLASLRTSAVIVAAYLLCHGLTAWAVTPVQNLFLQDITVFASLVYLPHGVRVLSVWLFGWRAVPALAIGAFLSELIFTSAQVRALLEPALLESIAAGALSALLAFEAFRLLGLNLYADRRRHLSWKWLLTAGAVASVINSILQSLVFSGLIFPEDMIAVMVIYAAGDLLGLSVSMLALMLIFRWLRLRGSQRRPEG